MSTLITTNGNITNVNTGTIKDSTGNTTAATIDSGGRIFQPTKPFIQLLRDVDDDYAAGATIDGFRVHASRGITHSSGVMTVPVTGLYMIGINGISNTTAGIFLVINNVTICRIGYAAIATGEAWSHIGGTQVHIVNAGEEVKFQASNTTLGLYGATSATGAVGGAFMYLIG
tara:strand:+ start:337 stop:852 length:516 start_codon:yes stop_codon:yes gene_type:complete